MCRINDAEGTWLGCTTRRTRTARKCEECGRAIAVGEPYDRSVWTGDGGGVFVNICCEHCSSARTWLMVHCGGWVTGSLVDELLEHLEEGYKVDRIHRLVVGAHRREWQRFDGKGLMPVPARIVLQEKPWTPPMEMAP